jgi:cysteine desulfurase
MDKRHYFDWAATALPAPSLGEDEGKNIFGNPSSPYAEGRLAKEALENARSRCAKALDVPAECLYFTSGGTESNALVLHSLLLRPKKVKFLYSPVEHPSVRENCLALEKLGFSPSLVEVEKDGRVSPGKLAKALEKNRDTRLAAIMAVNNETGAIMDMEGLSKILRAREGAEDAPLRPPIHFHSDLVQAAGKIPLNIKGWDLDSASFSAHKLGGPRGIGLLYLKKPLEALYSGGEQERGIRPGTENTAGALALAACLEKYASPDVVKIEQEKARGRWAHFIGNLKKNPRARLIPEDRTEDDPRFSPWILQTRFKDIPGEVMLRALDSEGFAVSTGSACSSSSPDRPVLEAMGLDEHARLEGIRISQGWSTTLEDIDALLKGIEKVLAFL